MFTFCVYYQKINVNHVNQSKLVKKILLFEVIKICKFFIFSPVIYIYSEASSKQAANQTLPMFKLSNHRARVHAGLGGLTAWKRLSQHMVLFKHLKVLTSHIFPVPLMHVHVTVHVQ